MVWKISTDELLVRYKAGERNFAGIELTLDFNKGDSVEAIYGLAGADLRGINLRGANLRGAVMEGVDLREADLFSACLTWADLSNSNLSNANLESVSCVETVFTGADLTRASLNWMNANGAFFDDTKIGGFENSILTNANFRDSSPHNKRGICGSCNLIWNTVMPDGTVEKGPYWGEW